jgi:phosphatidylserine decarboxylase
MKALPGALLQRLIPQRLLCRFIYLIARCQNPILVRPLNAWFTRHYQLDLSEAALPNSADYSSFNALFTRALQPGARAVAIEPDAVVSPVDGTLTQYGTFRSDTLVQAKGLSYSLADFVGEASIELGEFIGGEFATIYLAPNNYHRVHTPIASELTRTRYIPGARFSVNEATAAAIPNLFCRNERAVFWMRNAHFPYLLVMVGALNVSSIETATRGEIPSGASGMWRETPPRAFPRAAEIGRFNLGSTIVMVFPPGVVTWSESLGLGRALRLGESLGRLSQTNRQ